jgi:hypothetical protein
MGKLTAAIYFILFASCHLPKPAVKKSAIEDEQYSTLKEAVIAESKIGSKDTSFDHFVEIGDDLYPNSLQYKLTAVRTFLRRADPDINQSVNYWSSDDDSIRVILHEWSVNAVSRQNDTTTFRTSNSENQFQKMDIKFFELEKELTSALGNPSLKIIDPDISAETKRDDIKWEYPGKLKVYLLMFKNIAYREIRLITYQR